MSDFTNRLDATGMSFMENKGQVSNLKGNLQPDILFTAHSGGAKLFLTANGIYYQFSRQFLKKEEKENMLRPKFKTADVDSTQFYRVDVKLVKANLHPDILKEGEVNGVDNFYLAHCPNGILNVKNYSKITYRNVYPNIDWVVYSKDAKLEYDFIVKPGGKVSDIKLQYEGMEKISLDKKGAIKIETGLGSISEHKPTSYQQDKHIESNFVLDGSALSFAVKDYDKNQTLTIDPSIVWSTYYGGDSYETGYSCTTDHSGNVYMAGETASTSNITSGGFQNVYGGNSDDAFLVKFDAAGNRLWATYYGGENAETGTAVAVDGIGNVYLSGYTTSTTNISAGGFQNLYGGGGDAFLVKFNTSGNRLWATYYGGEATDYGYYCTTDNYNNIYLTGTTASFNGIAFKGFKDTLNGTNTLNPGDAFLVKFDAAGNRLWGTYYGGSDREDGNGCTTDLFGSVYLCGITYSATGIASNGFQDTIGRTSNNTPTKDAFLAKFNSSGNRLWATYYGGPDIEDGRSCVTDKSNNVYLAGSSGTSIYTPMVYSIASGGGFQNTNAGLKDAFLAKFNSAGDRLWATYYGGRNDDIGRACSLDSTGNIYLTGLTQSKNNIASGGFQDTLKGDPFGQSIVQDAFLVKFDTSGNRLWGTYYGGDNYDDCYSTSTDNSGNVYIAGFTSSIAAISKNGFQNTYGGGPQDAFLTKISGDDLLPLQLLSFTASLQNKTVNIAWQTMQEVNTSHFVIERSKDGISYISLQQVAARSNNSKQAYISIDNRPLLGRSFYRLKIVDKDGQITYSNVAPISYIVKNVITVSPNPANDKLLVQLQGVNDNNVAIEISDANGKIVYTKQFSTVEGINILSIQVAKFAKGTYFLTILQDGDKQTIKWMKE